jgi:hypothetical protein
MQGGYYYSVDEAARLASKGLVAPADPNTSSSRTTSPPGESLLSTGVRTSQDGRAKAR